MCVCVCVCVCIVNNVWSLWEPKGQEVLLSARQLVYEGFKSRYAGKGFSNSQAGSLF